MSPQPATSERQVISRVVVLDSGGFIGTHLCDELQRIAPHVELVGLSLPALDLTLDQQAEGLITLFAPDTAVVSLAAIKRQLGDNLDSFTANLKNTTYLARVLAQRPVASLLFLSSAAVYDEETTNTAITEETAPRRAFRLANHLAQVSAAARQRFPANAAWASANRCGESIAQR